MTLSAATNATLADDGRASASIRDDDEVPALAIADAEANEGAQQLRFAVTLDRASGRTVAVAYATGDGTATAGSDYTPASGTLTLRAGAREHEVAVSLLSDGVVEGVETFTVTLSVPLAAVIDDAAATGTIRDDDERGVRLTPTTLAVEPGHTAEYVVQITSQPTAPVTVAVQVPAGAAVSAEPRSLLFDPADWTAPQTVTATAHSMAGTSVTLGHVASGGDYESVPAAALTVAIIDKPPPQLRSLEVTGTGVGTMYPSFIGSVHHYAAFCDDRITVNVSAQALRGAARLTLLRASANDNEVSNGALNARVVVSEDHDIAIEVSDGGQVATYVMHCLPEDFPDITILHKTDRVMSPVYSGNGRTVG